MTGHDAASSRQRPRRRVRVRPLSRAGYVAELERLDPGGVQTRQVALEQLPRWRATAALPFRAGRWLAAVRWQGADVEQLRGALAQAYASALHAVGDLVGSVEPHERTWQRALVSFIPARAERRRLRPSPEGGWLALDTVSHRDRLAQRTLERRAAGLQAYLLGRLGLDEPPAAYEDLPADLAEVYFTLAGLAAAAPTAPTYAAAHRALTRDDLLAVADLDDDAADLAEPEPAHTAPHERTTWLDPPPLVGILTECVLTAAPPRSRARATLTA